MIASGSKTYRFITFLVLFSFLTSIGGHLLLAQTFAWVKMSYSFSQKGSVRLAFKKTFDGKHPCELCKRIKNAKVNDTKELTVRSENEFKNLLTKKFDSLPLRPVAAETPQWGYLSSEQYLFYVPPLPPPRV